MSDEVKRLGRFASLVTEKAESADFKLALEHVEGWTGRLASNPEAIEIGSEELGGEGIRFRSGDVLFGKLRPYLAKAWVADRVGAAVGDFHVYRPDRDVHPRFLLYSLLRREYIDEVNASTYGSKMPRASWDYIKGTTHHVPGFKEQRRIAEFLDRETAQIDGLIAKQEQLISTFAERETGLIFDRVTKGLEEHAQTDTTGLWFGSRPHHWLHGNIRYFAAMKTGHTPSRSTPEYWEDCDIPWFTLADVWQLRQGNQYLGETSSLISQLGLANSAAELLPAGTVVLSRTASVGFTGIMPKPMATSQDFWNWVCREDRLLPEYLWYQFRAMNPYIRSLMYGSTHKTIYQGDAASFQIVVPPLEEQRAIVNALDGLTGMASRATVAATRTIEVLRERRQALISAAVTGQIYVGGAS